MIPVFSVFEDVEQCQDGGTAGGRQVVEGHSQLVALDPAGAGLHDSFGHRQVLVAVMKLGSEERDVDAESGGDRGDGLQVRDEGAAAAQRTQHRRQQTPGHGVVRAPAHLVTGQPHPGRGARSVSEQHLDQHRERQHLPHRLVATGGAG